MIIVFGGDGDGLLGTARQLGFPICFSLPSVSAASPRDGRHQLFLLIIDFCCSCVILKLPGQRLPPSVSFTPRLPAVVNF
jgi:hypothetical protein